MKKYPRYKENPEISVDTAEQKTGNVAIETLPEMTEDEQLLAVAERILREHRAAFEELAK